MQQVLGVFIVIVIFIGGFFVVTGLNDEFASRKVIAEARAEQMRMDGLARQREADARAYKLEAEGQAAKTEANGNAFANRMLSITPISLGVIGVAMVVSVIFGLAVFFWNRPVQGIGHNPVFLPPQPPTQNITHNHYAVLLGPGMTRGDIRRLAAQAEMPWLLEMSEVARLEATNDHIK